MRISLIVILILIITAILDLTYLGFFSKVKVIKKVSEPYVLVYGEHIGDYKKISKVQDAVYYSLLRDYNIETYKGFSIYYDDPKIVEKANLRSIAGCILEPNDYQQINTLKDNEFKIMELERRSSIVVEMPFKNSFSVLLGIIKVYPTIDKYVAKHRLKKNDIMEIYDVPGKKIIYIMNIK